ncbi:het-eN, partial [Rhypophila decipiens]
MAFAWAGEVSSKQTQTTSDNSQRGCTKSDLFPNEQVYGLRVLYKPQDSAGDIIFIHGLSGNSYNTWTSHKGVYWPTQLLSLDFPNVRVMSFGYDADVTRLLGPVSKNSVRDHAASLIGDLASIREGDGSKTHPIILIAHSLGGLVAKKALCLSEQSAEDHERQLHDRTIAVAFCGTPHRGSGMASFATGVAHILKAARKRVNTDILALLKRDSEALAEIDSTFGMWLMNKGREFTLTCFSEEHELPGTGMVVSKDSSQISGYPHYSIPANHMDMVRFNSPEDIGYRRVKGELHRWIRDGFTDGRDVQGCLKSLSFEEMNDRQIEIENSAEGMCSWLLGHEVYQRWLGQSRSLIWIKGKPGAGKSTLMKFALKEAQPAQCLAPSIKTISFFFHGRGTTLQKNPLGLFRALAHQIGVTRGAYIGDLVDLFQARSNTFQSWNWKAKELEDMLVSSILPAILEDMPVRLFIDALDECGELAARQLVRTFAVLQQRCSSSRFGLSICFSCRHYPIVAPEVCDEICLEHENGADISLYIRQELERSIMCPYELEVLRSTIEKKSQHVFQWVVLVAPRIVWLFQEGNTLNQVLAHISEIPEELHSLYDSILNDLIKHRPDLSLKLFQWICFGHKAFNVPEFRCAMNIDATLEMSGKTLKEWEDVDYHIETDKQMEKKLHFLSGGLAEITKSGVQLIHQSVQDFLFSKGFGVLDPKTTWTEDIILGRGHGRLGRSCLAYFLAIRREHLTSLHLLSTTDFTRLAERYPLLVYALKHWPLHISTAEKTGMSQADVLEFLPGRSNLCLEHWELFVTCLRIEDTSLKLPHPGTTMVHEAFKYNIPSLATSALGWMRVNVKDGHGRTALSIAAQHSGIEMVRLLLSQPRIELNIADRDGRTALSYAVEVDDIEVVEAFLDRPELNTRLNLETAYNMNGIKGTTFDHVVRLQRLELLKVLLGYPKITRIDADALVGRALVCIDADALAVGGALGLTSKVLSAAKTIDIIQLLMESDKSQTPVNLNEPRNYGSDKEPNITAPILHFAHPHST